MFICYLRVDIFIPNSHSLKDRRQVLQQIKQRVRNKFNISVAQKPGDKWQRCELFFVGTNYTKNKANDLMQHIEDFIRFQDGACILEVERGVI